MPDDEKTIEIELKFDASAVAVPAQAAAREANELVAFVLNAVAKTDLTEPAEPDEKGFHYARMLGPARTKDERSIDYSNWILVRGFLELARGTKASLEEAWLYIEALKLAKSVEMTWERFNGEIDAIKKYANKKNFEQLLKKVNAGLREPTSFDREFLSMQKVRNILEHRGGIVGLQDLAGAEALELVMPRIAAFAVVDGQEVELQQHQYFEQGASIMVKRTSRTLTFQQNDRISFSPTQFNEFAFACHLLRMI